MKTQEEDREFLIKQLVSVKKENGRLRLSFDQASLQTNNISNTILSRRPQSGINSNMNSRPQSAFPQTFPNDNIRANSAGPLRNGAITSMSDSNAIPSIDTQKEIRYTKMISKLQKDLENMKGSLRNITSKYTNEVNSRTELQNFLKKCIGNEKKIFQINTYFFFFLFFFFVSLFLCMFTVL
jgi:hypothetical protein